MKKFSILLFSVVMFPLGINAHEQDTLKNTVEVVAETPVEVIKVDSLQQEIDRLKGLIVQYKQSETSLMVSFMIMSKQLRFRTKRLKGLTVIFFLQTQLLLDYQMIVCERSMTKTE